MTRSENRTRREIGASIDERREIPAWVYAELESNQSLRQFHDRSAQLADRLRRDSDAWLMTSDGSPVASASRKSTAADCMLQSECMPQSECHVELLASTNSEIKRRSVTALLGLATCASLVAVILYSIPDRSQLLVDNRPGTAAENVAENVAETTDALVSPSAVTIADRPLRTIEIISEQPTLVPLDQVAVDLPSENITAPNQSIGDPQLFFFALESTLDAIGLINSAIAEKVVSDPLEKIVSQRMVIADQTVVPSADMNTVDSISDQSLALLRELKRTSEFLVQSLPGRNWRSQTEANF